MKTGTAKLEVSPSHFLFSINQHPGTKDTGSTFDKPHKTQRKKTPSDLRRNARRMAEFLERKNLAKPSTNSSPENPEPSTLIPPSSKDESLPLPKPEDNSPGESSETSEESPSYNDIPRITSTRNTPMALDPSLVTSVEGASPTTRDSHESNDAASDSIMDFSESPTFDLAPPISPLSSPVKMNQIEEIRILLCAPNKAAAQKHAKLFPQSKFLRVHPTNKRNHFFFSTQMDSANLQGLKDNFSEFEIEGINIIMYFL